ncbi:MAG: hypothetical protein ACUVXI_07895 [bacterium]
MFKSRDSKFVSPGFIPIALLSGVLCLAFGTRTQGYTVLGWLKDGDSISPTTPRALSMGGAGIASGDDPSSNPANLTRWDRLRIYCALSAVASSERRFLIDDGGKFVDPDSSSPPFGPENSTTAYELTKLGFSHRVFEGIYLGLDLAPRYNLSYTYSESIYDPGGSSSIGSRRVVSSGEIYGLSLLGGVKLMEAISFGTSATALYGWGERERGVFYRGGEGYYDYEPGEDRITLRESLNYRGFGLSLGGRFYASEGITLGAVYHSTVGMEKETKDRLAGNSKSSRYTCPSKWGIGAEWGIGDELESKIAVDVVDIVWGRYVHNIDVGLGVEHRIGEAFLRYGAYSHQEKGGGWQGSAPSSESAPISHARLGLSAGLGFKANGLSLDLGGDLSFKQYSGAPIYPLDDAQSEGYKRDRVGINEGIFRVMLGGGFGF